jgi:8-oxo-dGTP pyrophosphatase MutT (NUDIX family)
VDDDDEDAVSAALRECMEEVYLRPQRYAPNTYQ